MKDFESTFHDDVTRERDFDNATEAMFDRLLQEDRDDYLRKVNEQRKDSKEPKL